jgi:fructose-1,6-bisphosphatase/inositol monophosphatase family enzyme
MGYERELAVARRLAGEAGRLALEIQGRGFEVEDKPDDSPVTEADTASEAFFSAGLAAEFPEDGMLGEEGSNRAGTSGRRWIVDPIDGTRDFARRNRMWCNLVGLEDRGEVAVGVATFPALGEQYWAVRGEGAWGDRGAGPERLRCSGIREIGRAVACPNQITKSHKVFGPKLMEFLGRFWAVRMFGGAADAMLLASGGVEVWFEPVLQPWDLAAISLIAKESGARYFDFTGRDTIYGGNGVICVPGLEGEVRGLLGI